LWLDDAACKVVSKDERIEIRQGGGNQQHKRLTKQEKQASKPR
jgi:hypothetical protein